MDMDVVKDVFMGAESVASVAKDLKDWNLNDGNMINLEDVLDLGIAVDEDVFDNLSGGGIAELADMLGIKNEQFCVPIIYMFCYIFPWSTK